MNVGLTTLSGSRKSNEVPVRASSQINPARIHTGIFIKICKGHFINP